MVKSLNWSHMYMSGLCLVGVAYENPIMYEVIKNWYLGNKGTSRVQTSHSVLVTFASYSSYENYAIRRNGNHKTFYVHRNNYV